MGDHLPGGARSGFGKSVVLRGVFVDCLLEGDCEVLRETLLQCRKRGHREGVKIVYLGGCGGLKVWVGHMVDNSFW